MGRVIRASVFLMASTLFTGCVAATALSAIPGVLVDRAVGFFSGQEASLPLDMQGALAAVQQGLERMSLHVNVLEPVADGYRLEFGNGELDGDIYLKRQTEGLTTMSVSAHRGMAHQESVEEAMVKEITAVSEQPTGEAKFDFDGYDRVYVDPDEKSRGVGWFRPGSKLHVDASRKTGWLRLRLPSGKHAFIKGLLKVEGA